MTIDVRLPQWGMGMQEGTIIRWHKRVGDAVVEDEVIADVETPKAEAELEAPATGVIVRILAVEGAVVPVNDVVAVIAEAGR
jgi:pyruvate/2-oxoglutarate dehydrogenase complex dihydrolipoamide acyltransferase (E2) component